MDIHIDQLPAWLQWILIFIAAVPVFAVWSYWQYVLAWAHARGERAASKRFHVESKPFTEKPIAWVCEKTLGKLMGFVLLVTSLYLFSETTFVRFWTAAPIAAVVLGVLGALKRSAAAAAAKGVTGVWDLVQVHQPSSE